MRGSRGSFKIEGLADAEKVLATLPKATGLNVLRRVARTALEPMAERARQLAPVDDADLKDSIAVSPRSAGYAKRVSGGKQSTVEMHMGPGGDGKGAPPQGGLQELGTRHHPPQPFMTPAWDEEKRPTAERVGEMLWPEVQKAVGRQARKAARQAAKG